LYPHYVDNSAFNVTYVANGGVGDAPTDDNNYALGSYADVASPGELTPPEGQVFLGWKNGDTLYQPGDKIRITGDMELTAIWGPIPTPTTITYKANGGTGDDVVEDLQNNSTHTIIANPFNRTGYTFTGWNTKADGTGESYDANDQVIVDVFEQETLNILYAQWERILTDVTAQKVWSGGHAINHVRVTLQLFRKIADGPEELVNVDPVVDPASGTHNEFNYKWEKQPTHDENGNEYIYRVVEPTTPTGYTVTYGGSGHSFTVTNTYHNIKNLEAKKYWYGPTSPSEKPAVWFTLYRTTTTGTNERVPDKDPVRIPGGNDSAHWQNVIQSDPDGNPYTFYVKETNKDGNDWVPDGFEKEESGLSVYNYKGAKNISFTVTKDWTNVPDAFKTVIKVQLKRDGENIGDPVELNAENSWSYTWTELPKYKDATTMYEYTVEEDESNLHEYVSYVSTTYDPDPYTTADTEITGTIKNKYTIPTGDVSVSKVWMNDTGEADPESVTAQLLRNGNVYKSVVLNEANEWKHTWTDLPLTDAEGNAYTYTVDEVMVPGYSKAIDQATGVITNTRLLIDENIVGTKIWVNGPIPRPTVWFQLWRNIDGGDSELVPGAKIKQLVNNTATVEWTGLAQTDLDGKPYTFSVKEVDADGNDFTPENYNKVESGLTVTNTYVIPKGEFSATKVWEGDEDVTRPNLIFTLYRQIEGGAVEAVPGAGTKTITATVLEAKWEEIELTDINGNAYTFSVKEAFEKDEVTNDNWNLGEFDPESNSITNTVKMGDELKAKLTVSKNLLEQIYNPGLEDLGSEGAIKFKFKVTGPYDYEEEFELSPGESKELTGIYYGEYTVEETDTLGFVASYDASDEIVLSDEKPEGEVKVTNTHVDEGEEDPNLVDVEATKTWVNGPGSDHTAVTLLLKRSVGMKHQYVKATATISGTAPNFQYKWEGLDKYSPEGHEYVYSVEEEGVKDGKIAINGRVYEVTQEGNVITNTYVSDKISVTGTKVWIDGPKDRPEIELQLYRNGEAFGKAITLKDATSYEWMDLDKADEHGVDYTYTVDEVKVPENYVKTVEGMTVTNRYVSPVGYISITKKWVGGPEEKPVIKLQLYRDGKAFGEVVELKGVTTYTWKDLDITDSKGNVYAYQVKEVEVPKDYKVSYGEDGLTIINTWVEPPKKPVLPETGSGSMTWMLITGGILVSGGLSLNRRKKQVVTRKKR
jgi:LPXTG-motif cell wall-anchored protein/uncharacterized repeat protein (TIGR02543 family)